MSKPEPTGGKSLEEILASIRKSLADEPPARQPEPPATPGKAAQPQPEAGPARACRGRHRNQQWRLAGRQACRRA